MLIDLEVPFEFEHSLAIDALPVRDGMHGLSYHPVRLTRGPVAVLLSRANLAKPVRPLLLVSDEFRRGRMVPGGVDHSVRRASFERVWGEAACGATNRQRSVQLLPGLRPANKVPRFDH